MCGQRWFGVAAAACWHVACDITSTPDCEEPDCEEALLCACFGLVLLGVMEIIVPALSDGAAASAKDCAATAAPSTGARFPRPRSALSLMRAFSGRSDLHCPTGRIMNRCNEYVELNETI